MNSTTSTVIISDWGAGRVLADNMITDSFVGISGTGGRLVLGANNIGGTAVFGGGILLENTLGGTVDEIKDSSTAGTVWEYSKALTVPKYLGLK